MANLNLSVLHLSQGTICQKLTLEDRNFSLPQLAILLPPFQRMIKWFTHKHLHYPTITKPYSKSRIDTSRILHLLKICIPLLRFWMKNLTDVVWKGNPATHLQYRRCLPRQMRTKMSTSDWRILCGSTSQLHRRWSFQSVCTQIRKQIARQNPQFRHMINRPLLYYLRLFRKNRQLLLARR